MGALRFLVIASEIPEILNLPWELLLSHDGEFLGINPLFSIRRFPSIAKRMATFAGDLRPRPLRLLFMACSPSNLATLDYEKEEEALFRAVHGQDVAFDSCDLGTFEELKEKVSEFKPHIVHLTGHGAAHDGQSLIDAVFPKFDPDASSHSRNTFETRSSPFLFFSKPFYISTILRAWKI